MHPWQLKNPLFNDLCGQGRNKDIKDFPEFNENEGITYLNLWDTMKDTQSKLHLPPILSSTRDDNAS